MQKLQFQIFIGVIKTYNCDVAGIEMKKNSLIILAEVLDCIFGVGYDCGASFFPAGGAD